MNDKDCIINIDYEKIEPVIKNSSVVTVQWMNYRIHVRKMISMSSVTAFVESAISYGVDKKTNTIYPEFIDLGIRANTVSRYTNAVLPESIEEQYAVLYGTNLFDIVCKNICQSQITAIRDAVMICLRKYME